MLIQIISSLLSQIDWQRQSTMEIIWGTCCTSSKVFKENVDTTYSIDVDFSENHTIPVKFKPQSLHWCHQEVTIHSEIIISQSEESYHSYVPDYWKHDQIFVHICLEEMLSDLEQHSKFTSAVCKCRGFCWGISLVFSIYLSKRIAKVIKFLRIYKKILF